MEIVYRKTEELVPYANNARTHTDEQVAQICASIREYGWTNPVLIDEEGTIIAGHGRVRAAKRLGMKEVPCIVLSGLTKAQKKAYAIADNKMALNAGWDDEKLALELEDLKELDFDLSLTGFDENELTGLEDMIGDDPEEDEFEEEPAKEPKAHRGDVYRLGRHTIMCGDSTSASDVCILAGGAIMDMVLTDPPYNVDYTGKSDSEMKIENDSMSDEQFHELLKKAFSNAKEHLVDGGVFYCWCASKNFVEFIEALEDSGLPPRQELIWNKNSMVIGRQDYQWKHEPCFYGWKDTGPHKWYGDRKQSTVIDWDRPSKADIHPTMKPIGLFAYQIKNSCPRNGKVMDMFAGSGTTIMACEETGRTAYAMEIDPRYVDAIIERWEAKTGRKAVLLNGGE